MTLPQSLTHLSGRVRNWNRIGPLHSRLVRVQLGVGFGVGVDPIPVLHTNTAPQFSAAVGGAGIMQAPGLWLWLLHVTHFT